MPFSIEPARPADVEVLPGIERAAASIFSGQDVPLEVLQETTPVEELSAAQRDGRLWVARLESGGVVGFALVEWLDAQPHLKELDVHPSQGRRGIGRALLRAVQAWARDAGHGSLTLTTFRDVPWNEPFYASAGFRALAPHELSPALRALLEEEARRGLDRAARVAMRCSLAGDQVARDAGGDDPPPPQPDSAVAETPSDAAGSATLERFDRWGGGLLACVFVFSAGVALVRWDWFPTQDWGDIARIPQSGLDYAALLLPWVSLLAFLLLRRRCRSGPERASR